MSQDEINELVEKLRQDQSQAGMDHLAVIVGRYYRKLCQSGVFPDHAQYLTSDFQQWVLERLGSKSDAETG